ncbi:MAG: hypothetical protein MZV70_13555 [Desulfobacterales bacterium]|nr:hypothetical protein [Desulfobacterales bacterium]
MKATLPAKLGASPKEQGRRSPSEAPRTLLRIAARHSEVLKEAAPWEKRGLYRTTV